MISSLMFFFIGGMVIGSFLNVCIYRVPKNESLLFPGSHCPHCNTPLKFYHNIPVISFLFLRGKCAFCGAPISMRYLGVELLSGLVSLILYLKFGLSTRLFFYLFLSYTLIVISFIDIDTQLIKNKTLLVLAVGGSALNVWLHLIPWKEALIGAVTGGGLLLLFALFGRWYFKKESMGMGDVKFAAALGLLLGWKLVLASLYAGYLFAALYFLFLKVFKKLPISNYVPMGPFFSLGVFIVVVWSQELFDLYISLII